MFGREYQPREPPHPELTPEEEAEPRERRLAVDEAKATDLGESADEKQP
jgi:hypothetical protein